MLHPGGIRHRIATTLNTAYGDGLLSENTLAHRLDLLFGSRVIDPSRLIGDLTLRTPDRSLRGVLTRLADSARRQLLGSERRPRDPATVLALDWAGGVDELLVGRDPDCDIVLSHPTVSRRHARLRFRDGHWMLHDLRSTNGTVVNDVAVVRCQLRPGDHLQIGQQRLLVD